MEIVDVDLSVYSQPTDWLRLMVCRRLALYVTHQSDEAVEPTIAMTFHGDWCTINILHTTTTTTGRPIELGLLSFAASEIADDEMAAKNRPPCKRAASLNRCRAFLKVDKWVICCNQMAAIISQWWRCLVNAYEDCEGRYGVFAV